MIPETNLIQEHPMSRLPAVDLDNLTPDQAKFRDKLVSSPRGEIRGPFLPLLHHPVLGDLIQQVGGQLRFQGVLPGKLRELAIIITARFWTAQYEWFAHRRIAEQEGLNPAVCDAIAERKDPPFADDDEKLVFDFVTEMLANNIRASDATFNAAVEKFGSAGAIEINCLCGFYGLIGSVLNNFDVMIPGGDLPLPE
jgi:4-carboxymuconolactone decarboxylase